MAPAVKICILLANDKLHLDRVVGIHRGACIDIV